MSGIFEAPFKVLGSLMGMMDAPQAAPINVPAPAPVQEVTPPPATLMTPTVMPSPNSGEVRAAKRKSAATQLARRGRSSTIMTETEGLGG